MLDLIGIITLSFVALGILVLFAKMLVALILLPLKLGIWMVKGALGLLLIVPVTIVAVLLATGVLPVVLLVVAVPLLACIGIFACLFA